MIEIAFSAGLKHEIDIEAVVENGVEFDDVRMAEEGLHLDFVEDLVGNVFFLDDRFLDHFDGEDHASLFMQRKFYAPKLALAEVLDELEVCNLDLAEICEFVSVDRGEG